MPAVLAALRKDGHEVTAEVYREPREVLTSAGAVEVTAPRVNDKRTDPAITKLTEQWKAEQKAFSARDLSAVDYVLSGIDPGPGGRSQGRSS